MQERLLSEYDLDLVVTVSSMVYEVVVGSEGNRKTIIVDTLR